VVMFVPIYIAQRLVGGPESAAGRPASEAAEP
jgi:hypothetical protein